jgi:hypothetical protein
LGRLDLALHVATEKGALHVVGRQSEMMRAAAELALEDARRGGSGIERLEIGGTQAWFKRSAFRGKSRLRWALKRLVLRSSLPRVNEYHNSWWLRERLFRTPLPLAAGGFVVRGVPVRQFLITEDVAGANTLEEFLRSTSGAEREAVLDEVAREAARMHAIGFVHHDLYPRNLLVAPRGELQRVVFLDAWAGGPGPQVRGAAYDLACLFLRAPETLEAPELERFLLLYASERAAQGRAIEYGSFVARVKLQRSRLAQRGGGGGEGGGGEAPPAVEW